MPNLSHGTSHEINEFHKDIYETNVQLNMTEWSYLKTWKSWAGGVANSGTVIKKKKFKHLKIKIHFIELPCCQRRAQGKISPSHKVGKKSEASCRNSHSRLDQRPPNSRCTLLLGTEQARQLAWSWHTQWVSHHASCETWASYLIALGPQSSHPCGEANSG
jgi:hypothetical protein